MKQIANWMPWVRERKMAEAQAIADYNQQHFFSREFFDLVVNELKTNLKLAFSEHDACNNYAEWIDRWQYLMTQSKVVEYLESDMTRDCPTIPRVESVMNFALSKLNNKTAI
jgi:hypothetical protein